MRILSLVSVLIFAASAAAESLDHAREYDACLALAERRAEQAFESALAWAGLGGGDAAQHCAGVALIRMGKPDHGAQRLQTLAQTSSSAPAGLRADLLAQAAQGWLLAEMPDRAEAAIDAAVEIAPLNPALFADRAQIRGVLGDYDGALADAESALRLGDRTPDPLLFKAAALRRLDRCAEALAAADRARTLAPGLPDIELERGYCLARLGRLPEARIAFIAASQSGGDLGVGEAARLALEQLD